MKTQIVELEPDTQVVEILGLRFSRDIFQHLAQPRNTLYRFERQDETATVTDILDFKPSGALDINGYRVLWTRTSE